MKTLKANIIAAALLIGLLGIACEHCDDEDYTREQTEKNNTSQIMADTTTTTTTTTTIQ
jgi:hypothetical protein